MKRIFILVIMILSSALIALSEEAADVPQFNDYGNRPLIVLGFIFAVVTAFLIYKLVTEKPREKKK